MSRSESSGGLRLRLRVENSSLHLLSAAEVSRLPPRPTRLRGEFFYELTAGNQSVIGSVPGGFETRGIQTGEAPSTMHGVGEPRERTLEVRVPWSAVSPDNLPRLKLALYRFTRHPPSLEAPPVGVAEYFRRSSARVANLTTSSVRALTAALEDWRGPAKGGGSGGGLVSTLVDPVVIVAGALMASYSLAIRDWDIAGATAAVMLAVVGYRRWRIRRFGR